MSENIHIGLLDLKNVEVAIRMLLIYCVHAEIHVIAYVVPVTGDHVYLPINPTSESIQLCPIVLLYLTNIVTR